MKKIMMMISVISMMIILAGCDMEVAGEGVTYTQEIEIRDIEIINVSTVGGPELTIYVPEAYDQKLKIQTDSGDVVLRDLVLEVVDVDMESGDLHLDEIDCMEVNAKTDSGDVELEIEDIHYQGLLSVDADKGKVKVMGNDGKEKYQGTYEMVFGDSSQTIYIDTDGGDVDVRQ